MNIGLIGYGGVGKEFIKLLKEKNINCRVKFIIKSDGGLRDDNGIELDEVIIKENSIKSHKMWIKGLNFMDVIDEELDFLVDLTPTNKRTGEPALTYIKEGLKRGINVVTGNKGPILIDYHGLKKLADDNGVDLGIGCTTGGALPSINGGLIDCAGAEIISIEGILNGTTNYILKEMEKNKISYKEALKKAQDIGIAETDPTLDVEGYDTAIKMIILANVLMGSNITLDDVELEGITKVSLNDIGNASKEGKKVKLLGQVYRDNGEVKIKVGPSNIDAEHSLYSVDNKNKGVTFESDTLGRITIIGGASGTKNAAASILRDIININKKIK
ncbi:homoserine dehydrogenase [Clostridium paraputrificum]|uniref:homoserine dehydrogenase n=1 Tax=Clostridium TaxID=1485 RepID=UPI003D35422E